MVKYKNEECIFFLSPSKDIYYYISFSLSKSIYFKNLQISHTLPNYQIYPLQTIIDMGTHMSFPTWKWTILA